ncbi:MAG TPA: hypothetical protein VNU71_13470 [Burkholderiaceae bacterium]|nr:hypothetical protein [Burkholderiaceae bacterium]
MQIHPLLSSTGEPVFTAGGEAAWKVAEYRGYVASLEWTKSRRKFMPTLVIWSATNVLNRHAVATGMWAITRVAMTELIDFDQHGHATGSASRFGIEEALEALPLLGKDRNDKQALHGLLDVLMKFGPELARMPVAPKRVREHLIAKEAEPMFDVTAKAKASGKTLSETSI